VLTPVLSFFYRVTQCNITGITGSLEHSDRPINLDSWSPG